VSLRGAGGRFVSEARAGFSARLREAFETVTATALGLWMEDDLQGGVFELPVWAGRAVAHGRVREVPVGGSAAPVVSCPLVFSTGFCSGFFSMDTAVLEWPSDGVGCAIREAGCDWFRLGRVPVVSEGRVRFPGGVGSDPVEVFRVVAESYEGAGRFTGNMVGEEGVLF
jgi:hypothetical protein